MTEEQKQLILDNIRHNAIIKLEKKVNKGTIDSFSEDDIEKTMRNIVDDDGYYDAITSVFEMVLGESNAWYDDIVEELFKK